MNYESVLTVGTGPDHSIFDVYIGGTLWQSYDGYAPTEGERVIHLPADARLEIRNRADKNLQSTGYVIRFKQLDALEVTYDERTIQYTYDALSRLTEANYNNGATIYTYGFDLAGNLTNLNGATRTYNAANQMTHDGTNNLTYDDNGNMTHDGVNSYVWDRANRLLSMGGVSYQYNGDGNRIQQDALQYILDLQPGLAQVIGDSDGKRYIHSPRGIHAVNDGVDWQYPLTDGLGSVRGYVGADNTVLSSVNYSEYGVPDTSLVGPAFTGEWRDETELQYHRARYYSPNLGIFPSLDSFEGITQRPMSLNGYTWVEGNVVNMVDGSGMYGVVDSMMLVTALNNHCYSVSQTTYDDPALECFAGCLSDPGYVLLYTLGIDFAAGSSYESCYRNCLSTKAEAAGGCKIEVAAWEINAGLYHSFVIFTMGGQEYEFRAGQEYDLSRFSDTISPEQFGCHNPEGGSNFICATWAPHVNRQGIDRTIIEEINPRVVRWAILGGEQACSKWYCLVEQVRTINRSRTRYNAFPGPNSNTAARYYLRGCNIPEITPGVHAPAWEYKMSEWE